MMSIALDQSLRPLTERQAAIVEYIESFTTRNGYAPSVRDIAQHFGINSPNGVQCTLDRLKQKGAVTWVPIIARSLRVTSLYGKPETPLTDEVGRLKAEIATLKAENARLALALRG